MTTNAKKSLTRFLDTRNGQRAVAAFVGVRSTDPVAVAQATETAEFFAPAHAARKWTMQDLRYVALVTMPSGVYAAKEVTL